MTNIFENYREFESDRLVYMSPKQPVVPDNGTAPKAATPAPEATEAKDKKTEAKKKPAYVKNLVKTHKDNIGKDIRKIETNYLPSRSDSNPQKHEAAVKFINRMLTHSDATFKKITDEHAEESMDVGEARKRATATANKINELIAGHKEHIEHIERVDTAESHEKAGKDAEKTEEKITEEKINALSQIVQSKYKIDSAIVKKISTYIVENNPNLVKLDLDVDNYENMQIYLEAVAENNKTLGESIDAEFLTAYTALLESTPYLVPTEVDIEIVGQELASNADLKEISKEQKGTIVKALATRFNIQMENGEIKYVIDHKDNTILDREAFVKKINNKASRVIGGRVLRRTRIRKLVGSVEDITEAKQKARETALGVKSIEDFANNENVQTLIAQNRQVEQGKDELKQEEVQEQKEAEDALATKKKAEEAEKQRVAQEKAAKEAEANKKTNTAKVNTFKEKLNTEITKLNKEFMINGKKTPITLKLSEPNKDALKADNLTSLNGTLTIEGYGKVGVTFDISNADNPTIKIDGEKDAIKLSEFNESFRGKENKEGREKLANRLKTAEENMQAIKTESAKALKEINVTSPITKTEVALNPYIDFNNIKDPIDIATITSGELTIATIQMVVKPKKGGGFEYEYQIKGEKPVDSIAGINTYLKDNQKTLIATAEEVQRKNEYKSKILDVTPVTADRHVAFIIMYKKIASRIKGIFPNFPHGLGMEFEEFMDKDNQELAKEWPEAEKRMKEFGGSTNFYNEIVLMFNNLGKDRIKEIEETGDTPLRPGDTEKLVKMMNNISEKEFGKDIKEADPKETAEINKLTLEIGEESKTLEAIFGPNFAHNLSMRHEIKPCETEKNAIIIVENGKDVIVRPDKNLIYYLQPSIQSAYENIRNGNTENGSLEAQINKFKKTLAGHKEGLTAIANGEFKKSMEAMLASGKELESSGAESLKGFGLMDLIALFQMISEALKADPPDLSILADIGNDVSHNRSPLKMMKEAKSQYEKKVNETTDAVKLLEYCNNPGSPDVNKEFDKKLKYRSVLRSMARNKLGEKLGVTVAENGFEQIKGGNVTKITTTGSGIIEIDTSGENLKVTRYTLEGEEGKEKKTYLAGFEDGEMKPVAGDNSLVALKATLNSETYAPQKPEADVANKGASETTPETTVAELKGVTKKYVEDDGRTLKGVTKASIDNVLKETKISSATIEIGEGERGKQKLPDDAKIITVTKNADSKFVISKIEKEDGDEIQPGKLKDVKLSIFDGDKITKTA